jgi:hypothetical protein
VLRADAFATASAKSPNRCVVRFGVDGPNGSEEPDLSNNVTRLVIDVIDNHDF